MSKEAMKLALEALENWVEYFSANVDDIDKKAITALREALTSEAKEQPAQIPDAFERLMREADKPTQVPEQLAKYVAALVNGTHEITSVTICPKRASKPWVGLTDDEFEQCDAHETWRSMRNVEAKLREKNA